MEHRDSRVMGRIPENKPDFALTERARSGSLCVDCEQSSSSLIGLAFERLGCIRQVHGTARRSGCTVGIDGDRLAQIRLKSYQRSPTQSVLEAGTHVGFKNLRVVIVHEIEQNLFNRFEYPSQPRRRNLSVQTI